MTNQILLHNSTPEELSESIIQGVKNLIEEVAKPNPTTKFLTRDQVCDLLNIDKSTLWHWTKKGKLNSYGIGARVYYKLNEVENAVKPLNI